MMTVNRKSASIEWRSAKMTMIAEKGQSRSPFWIAVGTAFIHAVRMVLAWHERARQYPQLLFLSDYALKDIGKTRDDIESSVPGVVWMPGAVWIMGEDDQPCWRARINSRAMR
jgi:uncharacterized protein YjiS (DUF1127 family)